METFVDEEADLIVHPVHHVQPVQLRVRGCFRKLESMMIPRFEKIHTTLIGCLPESQWRIPGEGG